MEATTEQLARKARRMVADIDPVEAVVLFGSRARGTEHAESDWDVAVLLDREPDLSIWDAVPTLENVNVVCKSQNDFRDRAHLVGSLEAAIVRDGKVLAGKWERPYLGGERIVNYESVESHLTMAASGVEDTVHRACSFLGGVHGALTLVSRNAQFAAEFTSKAAMVHLGISPEQVHNLIELADQIEREGPDDPRTAEWAAKVRSMNGLSRKRHTRVYASKPLELLKRPLEIVGTATEFFGEVLRDITETRDGFASHALKVAVAAETAVLAVRGNPNWEKIPDTTKDRLDTWADETQRIARLARSRTQQAAWGRGDPDESQGMSL